MFCDLFIIMKVFQGMKAIGYIPILALKVPYFQE